MCHVSLRLHSATLTSQMAEQKIPDDSKEYRWGWDVSFIKTTQDSSFQLDPSLAASIKDDS